MKNPHLLFIILALATCNAPKLNDPADKMATVETRELYHSMQRLQPAGILFGHHDDTGYGVGWQYDKDSSDVKAVCGSYPAVYGWDLAKIEHDSPNDINGLPFTVQTRRVKEAYERGGINTFCWHMDNPADGKTAWDTTQKTVAAILPGGPFNDAYKEYLNKAAKYLGALTGDKGEQIPILFRPFHEMTGNWFWWGANTSSPQDFVKLWRFTIDYLRNTWNLHNLLIVYSAADFKSQSEFLSRYPGDGYVDFVGVDIYCQNNTQTFSNDVSAKLSFVSAFANQHHKLSCLAETGYLNIPQTDWWTNVLLPAVSQSKISYLLLWRNAGTDQFFAPYPGQASAADFKQFAQSGKMIFQNQLTPGKVYGK